MSFDEQVTKPSEELYPLDTPKSEPGTNESGLSNDLIRFLVGTVLEGSDVFLNWLEGGKTRSGSISGQDDEGAGEIEYQLKNSAIGLGLRSVEAVQKNLKTTIRVSNAVSSTVLAPIRAISQLALFRPLRKGFATMVEKGRAEVDDWARIGVAEERRSRALARETASYVVEDVVRYLSNSPALEALIKSEIDQLAIDLPQTTQVDVLVRVLANNYIQYLAENPEPVQGLIQSQGDTYLEHLEANPDQVQSLIQGQGGGLIDDMTDELRELTVTGDSMFELLARKIFKKPPRAELPEPPPEVIARAVHPQLIVEPQLQQREEHVQ